MRYLWLFFSLFVCAEESFITDYEYGEMLYNNPRGVSCAECHGASGEGKVIVRYIEDNKENIISGEDIRKKTLLQMIHSVNSYHVIMPRYYLTDKEVQTIYEYLQTRNKQYLESTR